MATVYEAYDPRFQRTVALKVLPREFLHDPEFRARFEREARTIAQLEHPAIVPVYDFGEDDGQPFLVMRLMRGGDLADRLASGPLSVAETAVILKRLGSALDAAHSQGVIHRDLKPGNVLFDQYGDAYLADFGIAHIASSTQALTASGSLVGTPTYMSPEQVYGDKELDGRSDIYALGVILFQMLTGHTPYDADTPARVMMKHVMDPVPPIREERPDLPPDLDTIIGKAMAKERDERYSTGNDLAVDLNRATQSTPKSDLQAELTAIQADLQQDTAVIEPPSAAPPEPAQAPPPEKPPTPPAAKPAKPVPPTSAPAVERSGGGIPVWVWGLVALLLIFCLAATGGIVFLALGDGGGTGIAAATAVPEDTSREEQIATREAELALAQTTEAAAPETLPTDPPPPEDTAPAATAEPVATATAVVSDVDLAATRESIAATRAAKEETANLEETAFVRYLDNFSPIYGPESGVIPHQLNDNIELVYADPSPQNFIASTFWGNPYSPQDGGWDFGYLFRQADVDEELRLVVVSDGYWAFDDRQPNVDNILAEGDVADLLDTGADSLNLFELITLDDTGYFFLNGVFVASLDLTSRPDAGNFALGTGFYVEDEQQGAATPYEDFTLWAVEPIFGPDSGQLTHALDDLIKLDTADVAVANFIAEATFTNPFPTTENDWDFGFGFRDDASIYWLAVESTGDWALVARPDGPESDKNVQTGAVNNLNLGADEKNTLRLIALGDIGYFFLNDEFVEALDISEIQTPGAVDVFTAYYADHEIEGAATLYEDFSVWALP